MKKQSIIILTLAMMLSLCIQSESKAQSFYNYQTITKHTVHFVIAWQNKVVLGAGYSYRTSDIKFSEVSFEYRAPIDEFFNGKNYEVTAGVHNRFLVSKSVVAGGAHLKFKHTTEGDRSACELGLAVTFIGGYQIKTSLTNGPSSTFGVRATYTPTLFAKTSSADEQAQGHSFAKHTLEAGLHADVIIKRSLGLAFQPTVANAWTNEESLIFDDTPQWDPQGHLYFGPSFWRKK